MKTKPYYYKRTVKRITKMVQYYIDHLDTVRFLAFIAVNPITGQVTFDDYSADDTVLTHSALFFTARDEQWNRVPDVRSIEHWVLVDLKRYARAVAS